MELTCVLCSSLIVCMSKHDKTYPLHMNATLPLSQLTYIDEAFEKGYRERRIQMGHNAQRLILFLGPRTYSFNKSPNKCLGLYPLTYAISHNVCSCTHNKESSENHKIELTTLHDLHTNGSQFKHMGLYNTTIIIYCCQTYNPQITLTHIPIIHTHTQITC